MTVKLRCKLGVSLDDQKFRHFYEVEREHEIGRWFTAADWLKVLVQYLYDQDIKYRDLEFCQVLIDHGLLYDHKLLARKGLLWAEIPKGASAPTTSISEEKPFSFDDPQPVLLADLEVYVILDWSEIILSGNVTEQMYMEVSSEMMQGVEKIGYRLTVNNTVKVK